MSKDKNHNTFSSVLVRVVIFAFLYPILKGAWEGWSALAGKFPGDGAVSYLCSGFVFLGTLFLLSWAFGTAPARWFKKGVAKLWRYLILKRFSALDEAGNGSDVGKEVAYAEIGRFGARERPQAFSLGIITADSGDWVAVELVAPPGGTSRLTFVPKGSDLIWPTGRGFKKYVETMVTFGNGLNPEDFLPKRGHP